MFDRAELIKIFNQNKPPNVKPMEKIIADANSGKHAAYQIIRKFGKHHESIRAKSTNKIP